MVDPDHVSKQQAEQFLRRYQRYRDYGQWTGFALATIEGAMEQIASLQAEHGRQIVATRDGHYRNWDPQVLGVDSVAEGYIFQRIQQFGQICGGFNACVLSEEAGQKRFDFGPEPVYIISDPFDGSLLYKNDLGAFYFTTVAVFDQAGRHLATAIGDIVNRRIDFASSDGAWTARLGDDGLSDIRQPKPSSCTQIGSAVLETYLLKPKYLYQEADDSYSFAETFKPLLEQVSFIHANGGPGGFADVAFGRVDLYLAHKQPFIDVWSGIGLAQQANAQLSTFDGQPVEFTADVNQRLYVLCSANEQLHRAVLEQLQTIKRRCGIRFAKRPG